MNRSLSTLIEKFLLNVAASEKPYFDNLMPSIDSLNELVSRKGSTHTCKFVNAENFRAFGETQPEVIIGFLQAIIDNLEFKYYEYLYLSKALVDELENAVIARSYSSWVYCARGLLELAADLNYHFFNCTYEGKIESLPRYGSMEGLVSSLLDNRPSSVRRVAKDQDISSELYISVNSILKILQYLHMKSRTNWGAFDTDNWSSDYGDKDAIQAFATNVMTTVKHLKFTGQKSVSHTPLHYYSALSDHLHPAFGQGQLVQCEGIRNVVEIKIPGLNKPVGVERFTRTLGVHPNTDSMDDHMMVLTLHPASQSIMSLINSLSRIEVLIDDLSKFCKRASGDAKVTLTLYEKLKSG